MNRTKLIFVCMAVITAGYSCGSGNLSELEKLRQQQARIAGKIREIEEGSAIKKDDPPDDRKFKFVGVTDVITGSFDHYIRVQGKLDGEYNVAVFADVPGIILSKYANAGENVAKGQVLAQIDDRQYRNQLESLESQYNFSADMFEKQKRLWDQKIGSEVQYLQAKTNKESLEKQISSLKEQVEKFKIKSPVDGTIEECNIRVGSVVTPDPRSAAYRVVAFRNLKVTAEVSEAYVSKVEAGDNLIITFPDAGKKIEGKIDFVSRYINPVNRTFIVESRITEKFPGMKANMIAILQINDYHSDKSMVIPMNVIQTDENGSYVYLVRNKDKYHGAFKQPVSIGNIYNGEAEILFGLNISDKVITTGFQELIDGEFVRFQEMFAD